jgi:hypothetical protein
MKKLLASFAVTIYFAFACGVMVNYHYCMGSFDSFQLYKPASDWCGRCGMHIKKSHGCCEDVVKIVKLEDDHQTSSFSFELKVLSPAMVTLPVFIAAELDTDLSIDHLNHSPPLLTQQDVYLKNCVFRI